MSWLFKDPVVIMKETMSWLFKDLIVTLASLSSTHAQSNSKKDQISPNEIFSQKITYKTFMYTAVPHCAKFEKNS